MKIKCPVCDYEERHQYDNEPIKGHDEEYHKLLEKIHEKIEFWGARHPMVVKEFESLLENEK